MPYEVEYNSELGIVEFTFTGSVTGEEFGRATIEGIDLAKAKDTKLFLIDDSDLQDAGSVIDLYNLPRLYEKLGLERGSRGAVVLPTASSKAAEDARFHETVCLNRGWQVKVFTDRQEAIDWLTKK